MFSSMLKFINRSNLPLADLYVMWIFSLVLQSFELFFIFLASVITLGTVKKSSNLVFQVASVLAEIEKVKLSQRNYKRCYGAVEQLSS